MKTYGQILESFEFLGNQGSDIVIRDPRSYEILDKVLIIEGKNYYTMNSFSSFSFAYYFQTDIDNNGVPDMLKQSIPKDSTFKWEQRLEDDIYYIRQYNDSEVPGFNYITPLSLEPNTDYRIIVTARGTVKEDSFKVYAWSTNSDNKNQGMLKGVELTDEWKSYYFDITTDGDLEEEKQYIRLEHSGNDEGYVDIKEVLIFVR